jgi:hypothetical protein
MSSENQNWRFYLTSSLLGNWDRLEITVTYSSSHACPQGTRIGVFFNSSLLGNWDRQLLFTCMTSGNHNWRFYLTSSLLGNWDMQFLLTCMTSGNQNWRFYLTSSLLGICDRIEITETYSSSPACSQGTRI